eukprot:52657-Hanusia_phi.AAC.12
MTCIWLHLPRDRQKVPVEAGSDHERDALRVEQHLVVPDVGPALALEGLAVDDLVEAVAALPLPVGDVLPERGCQALGDDVAAAAGLAERGQCQEYKEDAHGRRPGPPPRHAVLSGPAVFPAQTGIEKSSPPLSAGYAAVRHHSSAAHRDKPDPPAPRCSRGGGGEAAKAVDPAELQPRLRARHRAGCRLGPYAEVLPWIWRPTLRGFQRGLAFGSAARRGGSAVAADPATATGPRLHGRRGGGGHGLHPVRGGAGRGGTHLHGLRGADGRGGRLRQGAKAHGAGGLGTLPLVCCQPLLLRD